MSTSSQQAAPVAIVTGGGSGIGRAIARRLNSAGYWLALAGRRPEVLNSAISELADADRAFAVPTDVTDPGDVDRLFDQVIERAGRVDLLVNNAGIFGDGAPMGEYPIEAWRATLDTNLTGSFLCARRAFHQMSRQQPRGGRIINNGSISAHVPRPHAVAYTAAKHGVTGLTKAVALEGRQYDIACGQIDIGNAATEITDKFAPAAQQADGSIAAEPTFSVEHVADAVLYMASLPLDTNVLTLTVMATKMPFVGRG